MKDEATLYDVLEVREDASDKEIRANYIALVKRVRTGALRIGKPAC